MNIAIYTPGNDAAVYVGDHENRYQAIGAYEGVVGQEMVHVDEDADDLEAVVVRMLDETIETPLTWSGLRKLDDDAYVVLTGLKLWTPHRDLMVTVRHEDGSEESEKQPGLPADGVLSQQTYELRNSSVREEMAQDLIDEVAEHIKTSKLRRGAYRVMVLDYTTDEDGEEVLTKIIYAD